MIDVMTDLETVGKRAGCGILSIGGVAFDGEVLGPEFYKVVAIDTCEKAGLHSDPSTLSWWDGQSEEAKKVLTISRGKVNNHSLAEALGLFNEYLAQFGKSRVKVWGNGSDFDNAILYAGYAAVDMIAGWEFYNSRCFRTLKALAPAIKVPRQGTYHNALDDAKTQANHANQVIQKLKLKAW